MVTIITTASELRQQRTQFKGSVGFVPTMGNLHAGHISLLEKALSDTEVVCFSIFVNPKQFGPHEDFNRYPRSLEQDLELIRACTEKFNGKSVYVYAPSSAQDVYPEGDTQTVSVTGLSTIIEGAFRPGHFDGVATVVYRLFDLVKPTKAYFGLKDYQQYLVIRQMVKDLILPIEIIGMPIKRDETGLALSSRNQYLSESQKKEALILSQSLKQIVTVIDGKRQNISAAQKKISEICQDPRWNYIELRDAETLSEDTTHSKSLTLLGVFQLGSTRLLDNIQVEIQ